MSLDAPQSDKMMKAAPAKKEWHFPSDGVHLAEVVYAETLEEAEKAYHQVKRLIGGVLPPETAVSSPVAAAEAEGAITSEEPK